MEADVEGTPFGRYRLIELLGRGGMGEVWRAHDTDTDRIVAIKLLPVHFSDDEEFQRRFRREAHAAARLNTPHAVPIHNYGEINGRLYVDMRLIEGRDLQTALANGPLDPARAVCIIEGVALALHAAHQVGLVHRDVKPSNILLDENDFAYLIDFGIARALDETRMTQSGNTIGTFAYIAPERLDSQTAEDARADIYSLACVLYESLTGHPPFPGSTTAQLITAHLNTPPPRPSTTDPNVPATFDAVIATGMAKNPDNRYATTVELATAAHDAITTPIRHPVPPPTKAESRPPPPPPSEQAHNLATALPSTVKAGPPALAKPAPPPPATPIPARADGISRRTLIARIGPVIALVAVIAVVAVVRYPRVFWPSQSSPTSSPPQTATSTIPATTTPAGPPPVAEAALDGLLLSAGQINAALGTSGMIVAGPKNPSAMYSDTDIADTSCLPLNGPLDSTAYSGSGVTAVHSQELDPGRPSHTVRQGVALFPSEDAASAFFAASAQRWPACSNRQYIETDNPNREWTVGPVSNTNGTLRAAQTLGGGNWIWQSCQRALTVANNVVIDVSACSENRSDAQSDSAVNIAHQIAAKVPT
jgi:serine/threonine-protein kinase